MPANRFLKHITQTAIEISEDDGETFHEYARRFNDYREAEAFAIDIQVQTQKLLMIRLWMKETYILETFEDRFGKAEPGTIPVRQEPLSVEDALRRHHLMTR